MAPKKKHSHWDEYTTRVRTYPPKYDEGKDELTPWKDVLQFICLKDGAIFHDVWMHIDKESRPRSIKTNAIQLYDIRKQRKPKRQSDSISTDDTGKPVDQGRA